MVSLWDEVRMHLEYLVIKRQGLDEAVAEFSTRSPEAEYEAAAKELKFLGRRAQTPLIYALGDTEAAIRVEALLALGRIGSQKAVETVIRCLDDSDGNVRLAAVQTLGVTGGADVIVPIGQLLRNDPDLQVRAAAPHAMVAIARRAGIDVRTYLTEALADPHPWVQQNARDALKILQDDTKIN
ncbi:MAG: HEAT repeat domain-containing protein [Anaerolineae bacterium]|nr:HEAT repeat domain-containing protein [Anaerolineae bacterium]